jgi:hypothetical protein
MVDHEGAVIPPTPRAAVEQSPQLGWPRPNNYNRKQQVAFVNMQPGEVNRPGIVSLNVPACTAEERKGKRPVDEAVRTATISPCQRPNEIVRHDRLPLRG